MEMGYLGGFRRAVEAGPNPAAPATWHQRTTDGRFELAACGARLFTWGGLALLVRGLLRRGGDSATGDVDHLAEELRARYLERGELAVDGLEGSFTLALLDGQARRVVLFRNLVGTGFTYYRETAGGFLFGSNLAELVDAAGEAPVANAAALPAFFLYRFVPGRETLFRDVYRLLPGEQVSWDTRGLRRVQRQTLGGLREGRPIGGDALDRLDDVAGRVLADHAAQHPAAVNLLSGGVDSSYLQAIWNRIVPVGDALPASASVSVDHPRTWPDTDYAVSAARALATRHTLVPADAAYPSYLLDLVATTGEPPNHVQSAYFGHLARELAGGGARAAICGEGADSLFGLGLANRVHNARLLRTVVPGGPLRRLTAAVAAAVGCPRLAATLRLASFLDDVSHPDHPVNEVAAFTHRPAVAACFGPAAVADALAYRRGLLDLYAVPADPMDRLHAAGFLGEAMDSAALWATLFASAGVELICPFLDSRLVRLAMNLEPGVRFPFRRPKDLLKRALARAVPVALARRPKLGFGQPIFEWLAPGGSLRPLAESAGRHSFVARAAYAEALARPNWFLYSLVCYDVWHRLFIERSLARPEPTAAPAEPLIAVR